MVTENRNLASLTGQCVCGGGLEEATPLGSALEVGTYPYCAEENFKKHVSINLSLFLSLFLMYFF